MSVRVWLAVGAGIEALGGGGGVWREPAACRKALGELLGVVPVSDVEIEATRLAPVADLVGASPEVAARLAELVLAIGDAVGPSRRWGIRLPSIGAVARVLEDDSERGRKKAGMKLAAMLARFREAPLAFVTLELASNAGGEAGDDATALASVARNAGLYGWKRALLTAGLDAPEAAQALGDLRLVPSATVAELRPRWAASEAIGGGLGRLAPEQLEGVEGELPPGAILAGEIPEGLEAAALVAVGRRLRGIAS